MPDLNNVFLFSNPGHPFAIGLTLAKLAAFTMDEKGNETFDTSGALDKLRKVSPIFHLLYPAFPFKYLVIDTFLGLRNRK